MAVCCDLKSSVSSVNYSLALIVRVISYDKILLLALESKLSLVPLGH